MIIDIEENGLWLFRFPNIQGEGLPEKMEGLCLVGVYLSWPNHLTRFLADDVASSNGSVWAGQQAYPSSSQSLRSTSLPGLNYDPALNNTQSFNFNSFNTFKTGSLPNSDLRCQTPKVICAKMLRAISHSIAFALTRQEGWLLLDHETCLHEDTLGLKRFENLSTTDLVSFELHWSPSGSILLQAVESRVPKLSKVSSLLASERPSVSVNAPVLLFPFGVWAIFRGIESSKDPHAMSSKPRNIKDIVMAVFQIFGLEIATSSRWLHVDIIQDNLEQTNGQSAPAATSTRSKALLWPADYILCKRPRSADVLDQSAVAFYENKMDPVSRAQAWYNGRFERSKVIEAEKRKMELEAQASRKAQEISRKAQIDGNSPNDHRMPIQDASAIYPTPPDGVQSKSHGTPMHGQLSNQDQDDAHEAHRPFGDPSYHFSSHDHQDLFGENDMGLTEADFEFFDDSNTGNIDLATPSDPLPAEEIQSEKIIINTHQNISTTREEPVQLKGTFISPPEGMKSQGL